MTTITVYNGDTKVWSDQFPATWPLEAYRKLARNWMKYTQGTRYSIIGNGIEHYSTPKRAAAELLAHGGAR